MVEQKMSRRQNEEPWFLYETLEASFSMSYVIYSSPNCVSRVTCDGSVHLLLETQLSNASTTSHESPKKSFCDVLVCETLQIYMFLSMCNIDQKYK